MKLVAFLLGLIILLSSPVEGKQKLIIFHAGSLSGPLAAVEKAFEKSHPQIDVLREASGSLLAIRKVTDLGKRADLIFSADYRLLPRFLFPHLAERVYVFAENSLVLCYRRGASPPSPRNWARRLLSPGGRWAFSDPNLDPCGYRSLMALALWALENGELPVLREYLSRELGVTVEEKESGVLLKLPSRLRARGPKVKIRPKSVELLALLEAGVVDFAFEYRSVALAHQSLFIELPPSQNLGEVSLTERYQKVSVKLKNGEVVAGGPIAYGLAPLKRAPHPEAARLFMEFLFSSEGERILREYHLRPLSPPKLIRP